MHMMSLRLQNFRSYSRLTLTPPEGVTVFVGENGVGKTNLLEAVHLCCLGRSHRTAQDRDMIRRGCDSAAVQIRVRREDGVDEVGLRLFGEGVGRRKVIHINGKNAARTGELMGHVNCVMFCPEDLDLVRGGPAVRRRFLDMLLSQTGGGYYYALQRCNTVLKQRGALLREMARAPRDGQFLRQLDAWDAQLAESAAPLVLARREACQTLDRLAHSHYADIGGQPQEEFRLRYRGLLQASENPAEDLLRALGESREMDLRRGITSCGPHRDDVELLLSGEEMRAFASQGQTRTAVLSLRLAELDMLSARTGEKPILLLDDVLSELDAGRRTRLMEHIAPVQTLITCTDLSDLSGYRPQAVLQVREGEVSL